MDKLKASDKLAFPLDLDMATLLASVTQDNGHSKVGREPGPYGRVEL